MKQSKAANLFDAVMEREKARQDCTAERIEQQAEQRAREIYPAELKAAIVQAVNSSISDAIRTSRKESETMNSNAVITRAALPTQGIGKLFSDFIAYIDRKPKTTRTYLVNLRQFMAYTRYQAISKPARQDVINFRDWLGTEHDAIELDAAAPDGWRYRADRSGNRQRIICKPYTVKQYIQSVRQFFAWTAAEGLYPNIAANIHTDRITETHKKDSLTAREVEAIERSIKAGAEERQTAAANTLKDTAGRMQRSSEQSKRLFAMYLLAVNAGLRTVEISRANIKDIEVKDGNAVLFVWGKGHAEPDAKKPLAPAVFAAIKEYLNSRTDFPTGTSPLFVSTGNRSGGKRIDPTTISRMLKRAMQEAGFNSDRLTAHSLRHTAGQNVMQITGDNIYQTQMYMRHSSPKTTEIYLDNETAAQDAAIAQRLFEHYHGGTATTTAAEKVQQALKAMNPAQAEQLAAIAAAMATR